MFPCGVGRGRISKIGWTRKAPDAGAGFAEVYEGNCKERVEEEPNEIVRKFGLFSQNGNGLLGGANRYLRFIAFQGNVPAQANDGIE